MLDKTADTRKRYHLSRRQVVDLEKLMARHLTIFEPEPNYEPPPGAARTTCRYHAGFTDERIRDLYRDPYVNEEHIRRLREELFGKFHPDTGDITLLIAKIAQLEERVTRLEYHQLPHSPLLIEQKPNSRNKP